MLWSRCAALFSALTVASGSVSDYISTEAQYVLSIRAADLRANYWPLGWPRPGYSLISGPMVQSLGMQISILAVWSLIQILCDRIVIASPSTSNPNYLYNCQYSHSHTNLVMIITRTRNTS